MKKFRSGFTMSELIIVLVIIGVLGYITFNKLFGAKTKQEIENSIKADLEVITNAADKYRLNSRDGKYTGLQMNKIAGYFPSNMRQMDEAGADDATGLWVGSLSFGEMCRYKVSPNANSADRTFNLMMNCSGAIGELGWNVKEAALTEQVFWEFINRKYGYSAGKGLVNPAFTTEISWGASDDTFAGENTATHDIATAAADLSADTVPNSQNKDGMILASDLRGF